MHDAVWFLKRVAVLSFVLGAGCSGSVANDLLVGNVVSESVTEQRPTDGDCTATFDRDQRVTIAIFDVPGVGLHRVAMPGDGWNVRCHPEDSVFRAENDRDRMSATVHSFDVDIEGSIADALARDVERRLESLRAQGTDVRPVPGLRQVTDSVVVGVFRLEREQRSGVMIFVQRGLVLPHRFLRYVINSFPEDPARGPDVISAIGPAVLTFGPVTETN